MRALRRIAITGAEGVLGSVLRHRLCQQFEIIAISRMPLHLEHVVETRAVDLTDPAQVRDAFADADAVVHLAATDSTVTAPWAVVHGQNMQMDYNVYEECVRTKVQRVVYASSNHVQHGLSMTMNPETVDNQRYGAHVGRMMRYSDTCWPNSMHAVGKITGEALGRYYALQFGLAVVALRIGWLVPEDTPLVAPRAERDFVRAMFLSHRDAGEMFARALLVPITSTPPFAAAHAVSNNSRRIFDLSDSIALLGYTPEDDAEQYFQSSLPAGLPSREEVGAGR